MRGMPAAQGTPAKAFDIEWVRQQFPSLNLQVQGYAAAFLDGPAGTQVPQQVIRAVENYFVYANANTGGAFETSRRNDAMMASTREAMADFFNCTPGEVVFGQNLCAVAGDR